jgi:phenylalanyl-tRNA synthetase beta chain
MKFSYSLIKTVVPKLPAKVRCLEALTMFAFEAEDGPLDAMEVSLPPNRYSDAASHVGIARELAAILDLALKVPPGTPLPKARKGGTRFSVKVEDSGRCPRYIARFFDGVKIKPSPAWLAQALTACGLRPINNVVDIMNYVMLETGQPLHAFDYGKLAGGSQKCIVIRRAKRGEHLVSIDGVDYTLAPEILVIADARQPLAIAGIKGGKGSEVDAKTVRILIEAANFENTGIYRASKQLNLVTDASTRFSHVVSPALAEEGMARATKLLQELAGAAPGECFDSQVRPPAKHLLKFDTRKFKQFIGAEVTREKAGEFLRRLGFKEVRRDVWEVPPLRVDVETHEDLAEEVARLLGLDALRATPPRVSLGAAEEDELVREKERVRRVLAGLGVDEVYRYSMVSREEVGGALERAVPLQNPTSEAFAYLRPSLIPGLRGSAVENLKHFDRVRLFEVGKVFARDRKGKVAERTMVGLAVAGEKRDVFFTLKGIVAGICKGMGVPYFRMVPSKKPPGGFAVPAALALEVSGEIVGWLGSDPKPYKRGHAAFAEIDLDALIALAEGEAEYRPLPRFPSVMRDISLAVDMNAKVGDIMQEIQLANIKLIRDVDLVDEYTSPSWKGRQGLTFRVIFQAEDRTLSAAEVDEEMKKIVGLLKRRFGVEVR